LQVKGGWRKEVPAQGALRYDTAGVGPEAAPQPGDILPPPLANIALAALDEHLHAPWKPGGTMGTAYQRRRRRRKDLPNWRLFRDADDFVVSWRRQDRIDKGLVPGLTSKEKSELTAANKRIAELETELKAARRSVELLREEASPKGGSRRSR
jgi:hypothetical protein